MTDPFEAARIHMVEDQLETRGITDEKVLKAMKEVPRHLFVGATMRNRAYSDSALPIAKNQTISQPYIVAIMTQSLKLRGEERVLEIGTGSGYQAAVLSSIVKKVFTIERIPELAVKARKILEGLGYDNVVVTSGDGTLGWSKFAPYDRIIITAGTPNVPLNLLDQLVEGGILVAPVGPRNRQDLQIVEKQGEEFKMRTSIGCLFVPLVGTYGWDKND